MQASQSFWRLNSGYIFTKRTNMAAKVWRSEEFVSNFSNVLKRDRFKKIFIERSGISIQFPLLANLYMKNMNMYLLRKFRRRAENRRITIDVSTHYCPDCIPRPSRHRNVAGNCLAITSKGFLADIFLHYSWIGRLAVSLPTCGGLAVFAESQFLRGFTQ